MPASFADRRRLSHGLALALLSAIVGAAFITRQSFWMDEAGPAFKALLPTFKDWWQLTKIIKGSDPQMPVYMFSLWVWEKITGPGEYMMRTINLPWLILSVLALKKVRYWPVVCLTSPFVLYYAGELRPYAMQIAGGALAAAALMKVAAGGTEKSTDGLHATAFASLLLAASSLTGAVWAFGLWLGIFIMKPGWLRDVSFWKQIAGWAIGAAVLGGYYQYTLLMGFRAAGMESASIVSVFYGFYEMIGLLGLGPGKDELRESVKTIIHYLPVLVPAFLLIAGAWLLGITAWVKNAPGRTILAVACVVLVPILILTIVGLKNDFRVVGRHLSPAIPAVLLPIALSLEGVTWGTRGRAVGFAAVVFSFWSAISLRQEERHSRDDFRQACAITLDALGKGQTVFYWSDMNAMRYYAYLKGGMPLVNKIQHLETSQPDLLLTDLVVINRPDLKYRNKDFRAEYRRMDLEPDPQQVHGFEIWRSKYR